MFPLFAVHAPLSVIVLIALALAFAYLNGYNDSGSMMAAVISTGAAGARRALILAAACNFVGPFLVGNAVAVVVGTGLVYPDAVTLASLAAGLLAAIAWTAIETHFGMPTSSTQALLGGLIGGGIAVAGFGAVQITGVVILVLALVIVPILSGLVGWLSMRLTLWLARGASPKINATFRHGQLVTSVLLAISHGAAGVPKIVGIIVLILARAGLVSGFTIPIWVVFLASLSMSVAIALGGWKVIRTLSARIYRLRPVHGFLSQGVAAAMVLGFTVVGLPVSTGQVSTSTLIGAGASERLSKVRWQVAQHLALSWVVTLPITALLAFILYPITRLAFHS
ncbi:MAG TPA: anion permease [Chloroflexota bacterium]|nr:anion permease [Chloroflexota bacterium]